MFGALKLACGGSSSFLGIYLEFHWGRWRCPVELAKNSAQLVLDKVVYTGFLNSMNKVVEVVGKFLKRGAIIDTDIACQV